MLQCECLRAARDPGSTEFAGTHCKEVCTSDEVGRVLRDLSHSLGGPQHLFQKIGCCGCLSVGRWIPSSKCCQESFEGFHQSSLPVVLSRDVQGAVPVTFPERSSQVANGTLESCCCHRFRTEASISSIRVELAFSESDKETLNQEESFFSGNEIKAGVISSGVFDKPGPPSPDPFDPTVSFFLL